MQNFIYIHWKKTLKSFNIVNLLGCGSLVSYLIPEPCKLCSNPSIN